MGAAAPTPGAGLRLGVVRERAHVADVQVLHGGLSGLRSLSGLRGLRVRLLRGLEGAIGTIGWSSVVSSLGSAGTIPVDSDAMDRSSERRSAAPGEAAAACGEDALGVTGAAGPTVGR